MSEEKKKKQFNIVIKAKRLVNDTFKVLSKSPKKNRADIIPKIHNTVLEILEYIIRANAYVIVGENINFDDVKARKNYQNETLIDLRVFDALLEICFDNQCILERQLINLSASSQELADMIQNWIESDKRRLGK